MKVAVLGAGAMGSVFGGRLALAGHDVQLLDLNEAHLDAINESGLHLDLDDGAHVVQVPARRPEAARGPVDLLLLFTKTFSTDAALGSVRHVEHGAVMTVQNGLGNAERVARHVARDRVIVGMTNTPADFIGPGAAASHGENHTAIMSADGTDRPFLHEVAAALSGSGLPCAVDPLVDRAIWQKVAFNAAINAILGLVRGTPGDLARCPEAQALANRVAGEVVATGRARGVVVDEGVVFEQIDHACRHHQAHKPSMHQDLAAGRRTEIDALNGAVVELARAAGVPVPLNDALTRLVKLAELTSAGTAST